MEVGTELSAGEQKYFDTRGAVALTEETAQAETPAPEAPAQDEAEPESPAENTDEGKVEADNPGKFVRHGAFHEERQRRKEIEQNFARYREEEAARVARMEERLSHLANTFKQPEPVITDPNERLARVEQTLQQRLQQEAQEQQAVQQQNALFNVVSQHEREFAQEKPDYYKAVEFAKQVRLEEFKAMGFDDAEAEQILLNDVLNLTKDALGRRINPAERFYKYAVARGWGKQEAVPAAAAPPPAGEKLKVIAQGQAAAKSLGAAPGTSSAQLTLQALADMPQDEFDKIDAKTWKKMMGGA